MSQELTNKFNALAIDVLEKKIKLLEQEKRILEQQVLYWRVESHTNEGRWIRALEDLNKFYNERRNNEWQPISTAPIGELVICLWGHRTIGTQIFYHPTDLTNTYAKYWMAIPPVPNDNERHP